MRERLPFADEEDYTLIDTNFDEFIRRGLEEYEWERKNQKGEC